MVLQIVGNFFRSGLTFAKISTGEKHFSWQIIMLYQRGDTQLHVTHSQVYQYVCQDILVSSQTYIIQSDSSLLNFSVVSE